MTHSEGVISNSSSLTSNSSSSNNTATVQQLQAVSVSVVQEVLGTAGMGHNNPRQKIQYHLRLKQELEETRHECMLLLRERFHLEQCVRYLAVRSQFPVPGKGHSVAQGGGQSRSPLEKNPVQPASLRRHHLYATPVSRRSLMLAGRGKQALQEGQAWQSKVPSTCVTCSLTHPLTH